MKKLLIILPVIFFFISCSKKMNKQSQVYLDAEMEILLFNHQGEDLLNPETPSAFNNKDIYTFELNKDGSKTIIIQKDLVRTSETGQYYLYPINYKFSRPLDNSLGEGTFYLHLNDQTIDTVKVEMSVQGAVTYISKIWYNSKLKWSTRGTPRIITIVK